MTLRGFQKQETRTENEHNLFLDCVCVCLGFVTTPRDFKNRKTKTTT